MEGGCLKGGRIIEVLLICFLSNIIKTISIGRLSSECKKKVTKEILMAQEYFECIDDETSNYI